MRCYRCYKGFLYSVLSGLEDVGGWSLRVLEHTDLGELLIRVVV